MGFKICAYKRSICHKVLRSPGKNVLINLIKIAARARRWLWLWLGRQVSPEGDAPSIGMTSLSASCSATVHIFNFKIGWQRAKTYRPDREGFFFSAHQSVPCTLRRKAHRHNPQILLTWFCPTECKTEQLRPRPSALLITLSSTLIITDITKTSSIVYKYYRRHCCCFYCITTTTPFMPIKAISGDCHIDEL